VIDTLGVVPGYRTELTRHEFTEAVAQSGFGNTLATGVFAPDDGILFKARQKLGAQNIPSLVIASLLSKKLSAGLTRAVFDVRTMDGGNFGANLSEAETNIRLLQRTATLLGIDVRCAPSDGRVPSQPMLGRAEALRGLLSLLNNSASPWLERHFETCVRLAVLADERAADGQHDRKGMRSVLDRHFRAQGADGLTAAGKYLEEVERTHLTSLVTVPSDGVISWDTVGLRTAITDSQSALKGTRAEAFPDSCGVELLRNTGDVVEAGIPVARVRGQNSEIMKKTMEGVARSMTITAQERDSNTGDSV
jgi:thymidine phosphorylase